jgi:hypothetical protein
MPEKKRRATCPQCGKRRLPVDSLGFCKTCKEKGRQLLAQWDSLPPGAHVAERAADGKLRVRPLGRRPQERN